MDSKMITAAGIAGVAIGILSGVPCVSALNCVFCAWIWGGGIFAAWYYNRSSGMGATTTQGATMGAVAGLIGAVITTILGAITTAAMGPGTSAAQIEQLIQMFPDNAELIRQAASASQGGGNIVVSLCISLVLFAIFGAIGGAIGASIFSRRSSTAM